MNPDFSGYATRWGVKCTDGRTIMKDAFKHNDGAKLPLVWQHGHNDPDNVLGHAVLENRDDGMYAYGFFNDTPKGKNAKISVAHGDLDSLSIFANRLQESNNHVTHGEIREVSLVLSGANPEARIDQVFIKHSDGFTEEMEDEAVIMSGETLHHADDSEEESNDDRTVADVINSMDDDQRSVLEYLVGQAYEDKSDDADGEEEPVKHSDSDEGEIMHNVFESNGEVASNDKTMSHSEIRDIFEDAQKNTKSLHDSIIAHAESKGYGVDNIEFLFPEAKALMDKPEFISRDMEWVQGVLSGTRKVPFTRIKSMTADITADEARAKGYITGNMKKEEFFGLAKRETHPTTIYKKQKLDRDDIIDVTTMDVVAWLWAEMRTMLNEEIARAILIGDGREVDDEDKIDENKIRPIAHDHEFYTHPIKLEGDFDAKEFQKIVFRAKKYYKGSGAPTFFTSQDVLTEMLLAEDQMGRPLYESEQALANKLGVSKIVVVPQLDPEGLYQEKPYDQLMGLIVNLADYSVGTDRGGEIARFDDFDIDYNQYKYLLEGRMSGCLTKPKSAIAIWKKGATIPEGEGPEPADHKQVENPLSNHPQNRPGGKKPASPAPKPKPKPTTPSDEN